MLDLAMRGLARCRFERFSKPVDRRYEIARANRFAQIVAHFTAEYVGSVRVKRRSEFRIERARSKL
jgi:hypothetical protein